MQGELTLTCHLSDYGNWFRDTPLVQTGPIIFLLAFLNWLYARSLVCLFVAPEAVKAVSCELPVVLRQLL